jgi:dienelactone hydrolase
LAGIALVALPLGGALAQTGEVEIVDAPLNGAPSSGPHAVVVEHDPGLETHTIYRPAELGPDPNHVLVWGEGGCANNGLMFPEFLAEIASHGFVVIADGPPNPPAPPAGRRGGGRGNAPPQASGGAPAAPPRIAPDGTDLVAAMDWIEAEAANPASRFYQKVEVSRIAAMGMSCGGLMSYGASNDPRVATVGIWNSGLLEPDAGIFEGLHSSVIIVTGGESDIAYANGKRDFETLPPDIPVFYGVYPSVGHGGTYNQDNGGPYGKAAVAWLNWQLGGVPGANGRGYFTGNDCGICGDENWVIDSRSLP